MYTVFKMLSYLFNLYINLQLQIINFSLILYDKPDVQRILVI